MKIAFLHRCFFHGVLLSICFAVLFGGSTLYAQFGQGGLGGGGPDDNTFKVKGTILLPKDKEPAWLFITAQVAPGWHIYSITQAEGGPIRTKIQLKSTDKYKTLGDFQAAPSPTKTTDKVAFGDLVIETHEETVVWYAPIEIAPDGDAAKLAINGDVTVQLCDANNCFPPKKVLFKAKPSDKIPEELKKAKFDPAKLPEKKAETKSDDKTTKPDAGKRQIGEGNRESGKYCGKKNDR